MRLAHLALVAAHIELVAAVICDRAFDSARVAAMRVPAGSVILTFCPVPARARPASAGAVYTPPAVAPPVAGGAAPSACLRVAVPALPGPA